jgi:hypothetical protein
VAAAEWDLTGIRLLATEDQKRTVLPILLAGEESESFPPPPSLNSSEPLPPRRLAQPFHVPQRRLSELPLVLPAELRGVVVAHPEAGAGGVQVLAEQDAPCLLEPELFLELQGAHRRDRLEVVVKTRDAHPELPRQAVDPQRLVEVPAEPLDGFRDAVGVATQKRQVTEPVSLVSRLFSSRQDGSLMFFLRYSSPALREIPCLLTRIPAVQ